MVVPRTDYLRPVDRPAKMLDAYSAGASLKNIADRFSVSPQAVRANLKAQGVEFDQDDRTGLWTMPEERRREAIVSRAAKGAAQALRQFHSYDDYGFGDTQ